MGAAGEQRDITAGVPVGGPADISVFRADYLSKGVVGILAVLFRFLEDLLGIFLGQLYSPISDNRVLDFFRVLSLPTRRQRVGAESCIFFRGAMRASGCNRV